MAVLTALKACGSTTAISGFSYVVLNNAPALLLRPSNLWSGRRESNPRPTAWKAVTLPLSYSRVQVNLKSGADGEA